MNRKVTNLDAQNEIHYMSHFPSASLPYSSHLLEYACISWFRLLCDCALGSLVLQKCQTV